MPPTLRLLLAGAALALTAPAAASAQTPIPPSDFNLVTSGVSIQGARGAVV